MGGERSSLVCDLKGPYYFIIISTGAIDADVGKILEPLLVGINLVNVTV